MESLETLSQDQHLILEQLQTITGIDDLNLCIEILSQNNWNLQRAVERVLDNDFGTTRQSIQPSLFSFLTKPIVWGFKFLWNIINFIFELFPKRIRYQTISKPFHEKFKELYGEKGPVFLQGSYSQALEKAKQDLLFLLVILHSEDHDDTHQFCIETLVSEPFVNYINEKNILVWGGNVKESEAYKVSTMLGATKYPFMAFIALHENRMKVVHRFEGMIPATSLVDTMDRLIERLNRPYEVARQERASREAARSIREQQDAAYQESLRLDREKAERLRLEQQEQMEKEQQEQDLAKDVERKKLKKQEYKKQLALNLVPEPDSSTKSAKLNIRLPNGTRLVRTFDATASIKQLYDFVESNDLDPIDLLEEIVIVNTYPRKEYRDQSITFEEAGLYPNATVIVEELFDE